MLKPNILLITCDQMRADAMGCAGNPIVQTPHLDALAASGVRFANAFTPYPVCEPARASITTGLYPHKCQWYNPESGGEEIHTNLPVLGTELSNRGYSTYAMGKLHYHPYTPPGAPKVTHGIETVEFAEEGRWANLYNGAHGLEDYLDYLETVGYGGYSRAHAVGNNDIFATVSPLPQEHYVDSWVATRSIHYMQKHVNDTPEKPFFMWASFPKPHSPYDPPRPYDAMYDPREIPPPTGAIDEIKARGLDAVHKSHFKYHWNTVSDAAKQVIKAHYYGLISFQDKQVGRMMDFLENAGIRDNTIVIFTSDHGDMMGDFGLYFKTLMYRPSVNVPFIVSYPKRWPESVVSDALVGLQDIFPTLMNLSGAPAEQTDGLDLTAVVNNKAECRDAYVAYFCTEEAPESKRIMYADKQYKYIYNACGAVEELYDTVNDSSELNNLANLPEYEKICTELKEKLYRWCVDNNHTQMLSDNGFEVQSCAELSNMYTATIGMFGRRKY
ncbi:MAG: sulfatase-like hydrolase/transferase [Defluviitaleaceae bacterium]|nr:sulfatase-like hydrolase/transferase [Defluviitaleaceae bacterium]